MKAAVIVFPGSNCDRDLAVAMRGAGFDVSMVWHKESVLPAGIDVVGLPGGFSFGDYLRCGAIAARSPIVSSVTDFARSGGYVLGICNGFQILTETGLLPGALMRNRRLKYICRTVPLIVQNSESSFTHLYRQKAAIEIPIAHHDGNYVADASTLDCLQSEGRIAFTYAANPNGSQNDIAGILSGNGRILGMMPHPERASDSMLGNTDGRALFDSLAASFAAA